MASPGRSVRWTNELRARDRNGKSRQAVLEELVNKAFSAAETNPQQRQKLRKGKQHHTGRQGTGLAVEGPASTTLSVLVTVHDQHVLTLSNSVHSRHCPPGTTGEDSFAAILASMRNSHHRPGSRGTEAPHSISFCSQGGGRTVSEPCSQLSVLRPTKETVCMNQC